MSYLVISIALLIMKIPHKKAKVRSTHLFNDFKEGFTYVRRSLPMRSIIYLLALVSLMGMPYQVLMPVFAKQVLGGGPHTLGFLMGAAGLGALCGAIFLASRMSSYNISKLIPSSAVLFGIGLIIFSLSKYLWLSLLLLLFAGCGMMLQMAVSNTVLQIMVDDDKRGRVMAFYAMAFMGMAPFGSLLAGSLAGLIGAPHTLMIGGTLCVLGAFVFSKNILSVKDSIPPTRISITPETVNEIDSMEEIDDFL